MKKAVLHGRNEKGLFLFIFIPCLLIGQTLDNDIWFLLTSGRYVLENGFPTVEPFTIHQGLSFVMQQWLTASLFWTVYNNLGVIGLFALVILFYGLIVYTVYRICMLISDENFIVSYSITLLTGILISFFMLTRPYIISTLSVVLEVFCLESYIKKGSKRYLYALPLLSLFEVNFHAAMWPMLFVILIPYWIDAFKFRFWLIKGQGYSKKPLLIITGLMLAAGFVNPYGLNAMTYLIKSYGSPEIGRMIQEMLPADINTAFGKIIFCSMFAVILIYALYRKGDSRIRYILLTLGTAFLTLSSIRGFVYFILLGFFPLSFYLKGIQIKEGKKFAAGRQIVIKTILIILVCAGIGLGLIQKYNKTIKYAEAPEGAGAVSYLLEHEEPATALLYTSFDMGGYAEYMGFKCYIDPRAEVFIKKNNGKADIMSEYYQLQTGQLYYGDFLGKYHFTQLLTPKNDILYVCLSHDSGYQIVYEDDECRVFQPLGNS